MSHRRIPRKLLAGITAASTAGAVAVGLLLSPGSSTAEPRELTMLFDCTFPLIGVQRVSVTISADIPATIPVNTPSDPFVVNAVANAGVNATAGLVLVGATTIEGFSDAGSRISAPGIDLPITVPAQIPVQPVPPQGQPLILNASGTSPSVTFPQTGTARISVETLGLRALHPRNAQGGDTGLGVFDAPCTTVPGQNTTLAEITITEGGGGGDTEAPGAPGQPQVEATTTDSVSLGWHASTDNVGVAGYDVFNGSTLATSGTGTSATVSGLTADTSYTFTVQARDAAGNTSPASAAVTARTQAGGGGGDIPVNFALTGSSFIKAANGTIQLTGAVNALFNLTTGTFSADLRLNPTTGRFTVLGFLPASAQIEFVQAARTTGALAGGVLTANAKTTVKLPRVNIFGFPVAGGPNCKSSTPADIPLRGANFDPIAGGSVSGTYTIPALTGCGPMTGLVSMLTTGPGNTIAATLAPAAGARSMRR